MSPRVLSFLVFTTATYGMWYVTYRRYDLASAPHDSAHYLDLCHHLWDRPAEVPPPSDLPVYATRPLRYRVLTPLLVRAVRATQLHRVYDPGTYRALTDAERQRIPGAARDPFPEYRELLYYFTLVNFLLLSLAAVACADHVQRDHGLPYVWGLVGGLIFLSSFYNVLQSYAPHSDAGAYLFIFLAGIAYHRGSRVGFLLATLLGVLQKETVLLVVGLLLALELLRGERRALGWIVGLLPAVGLYVALAHWLPVPGHDEFYTPRAWLSQFAQFLDPATYNTLFWRRLVLRHLIGNAPLLAAGAGHLFLKSQSVSVPFPWPRLLLFPALLLIGVTLEVNVGRVAALGAVVYIPYVLRVLEAATRWVESAAPAPQVGV